MVDTLHATSNHPIFVIEGGESLVKKVKGRAAPRGRVLAKARLIAAESVSAELDAAAIGASEWSVLGRDTVLELVAQGYPALAANLVCEEGRRPLPAVRVLKSAGRSVGVVGVTEGPVEGCTVTSPVRAVADAVAQITEPVDTVVLLWPSRGEAAHSAALKGLPVDFVLDASGRIARPEKIQQAGTSWLVGAGGQTKAVGQLTLTPGTQRRYFPEGFEATLKVRELDLARRLDRMEKSVAANSTPTNEAQLKKVRGRVAALERDQAAFLAGSLGTFTFESYSLDEDVEDDGGVKARVQEVKDGFAMLSDATPSEILTRPLVAPEGSTYAGAQACGSCHPGPLAHWRKTPHSRAYTALVRDTRHLDDDCYSCHVTGAGTAVNAPEEAGGLIHVQCESCHGPSAAHVADPSVKPVRTPTEATCKGCHDGERDEGQFDYATYLPKVVHPASE